MKIQIGLAYESCKHQEGLTFGMPSDSQLFARKSLALVVGRRDRAAFQVLVKGSELMTVSVGRRAVFSPRGALANLRLEAGVEGLPAADVQVNLIGLIEDDDRLLKADLLLHDEVVTVEAGRVQPVWVEVFIPAETLPGVYHGRVALWVGTMFEPELLQESLDFSIEVKDVLLAEVKDYTFHLDLWQHLSNIARKHEAHLWSDRHFAILEPYVKSLGELGQKAVTVVASEIPWSGQGCFRVTNYPSDMFEYNMVRVEKGVDGSFSYDFSAVERYVELCFKYHIDREIEVFGLTGIWKFEAEGYGRVAPDYPDATRIRYLDRADGGYRYMQSADEITAYIQALEQFFIRKGWMDRVLVVADEPGDKAFYFKMLALLHEAAPAFHYKAAVNKVDFIAEAADRVDDFVPILDVACRDWDNLSRVREQMRALPHRSRLLWYVCCAPAYPNTFIHSPLLESRLIGWLTAYMELDGFLRWAYTAYPETPHQRISYLYPHWSAGDCNFVYPSASGEPLLSLRYKLLQRGIEEFELVQKVKRTRRDAGEILERAWGKILKVREMQKFYAPGAKAEDLYALDEESYNAARRILLEALE